MLLQFSKRVNKTSSFRSKKTGIKQHIDWGENHYQDRGHEEKKGSEKGSQPTSPVPHTEGDPKPKSNLKQQLLDAVSVNEWGEIEDPQ